MENVVENQEKLTIKRKPKLNGFAGLKVIAVLLMFYWHSELAIKISSVIDFGARCCEFLFVVSGFLVVYNYKKKYDNLFKETLYYSSKKLIKIWPLHIVALFVILFVERATFSASKIPTLILNALLLQSWSNKGHVIMSFNGISWFLSALFLCYLLTPILVKLCKNYKLSAILLIFVMIGRLLLDKYLPNIPLVSKVINLHTSCLVRLTEFFMGMLLCPIVLKLKDKICTNGKKWSIIFSCLEIATLVGVGFAIRFISQSRAFFVILMCMLVFVFAFDKGLVSKLFSFQPIKFLSNIQFEFFILHYVTLVVGEAIWFKVLKLTNVYLSSILILIGLIIICYIYNKFISRHVEKLFKKVLNGLFKLFKTNVEI